MHRLMQTFFRVVVVLTLSLSWSVTYGQDVGGAVNQDVAEDAGPVERKGFKLPVQIIEDPADARGRQEKETAELALQERDLAAQEGMNAATQSIETATWVMAVLSGLALVATIFGLVAIFQTLKATQAATAITQEMARKTQEMLDNERRALELEYRPLVSVEGLSFSSPHEALSNPSFYLCQFNLKNAGRTPARIVGQEVFRCYKNVNRLDPGEAAKILGGPISQSETAWTGFLTSEPRLSVGTSLVPRQFDVRRRPTSEGLPFASDLWFSFNFAVVALRVLYQFGIGDDARVFETTAGYVVRPKIREDGSLEGFAYEIAPDFWKAT